MLLPLSRLLRVDTISQRDFYDLEILPSAFDFYISFTFILFLCISTELHDGGWWKPVNRGQLSAGCAHTHAPIPPLFGRRWRWKWGSPSIPLCIFLIPRTDEWSFFGKIGHGWERGGRLHGDAYPVTGRRQSFPFHRPQNLTCPWRMTGLLSRSGKERLGVAAGPQKLAVMVEGGGLSSLVVSGETRPKSIMIHLR